MARLRTPPPAPVAGGVPDPLTKPLDPLWRNPTAVAAFCRRQRIDWRPDPDLGEHDELISRWRQRPDAQVSLAVSRWRTIVTRWAIREGILNPKHPLLPDWDRLAELGICKPTSLSRAWAEAIYPNEPPMPDQGRVRI